NLLVFSTYFGGTGYDNGNAIASDSSGSVYIAGDTDSTNLPVLNALQSLNRGRQDGFAAKFSSTGALQYSTYLGGSGDDRATAIAVDSAGAAYLTGSTTSPNFPVANAFQAANAGGQDAFVTKLNAGGSALVYSTYLGGSGGIAGYPESGNGIAVDSALSAYVTGVTHSANFPTLGAFQTGHAGGGLDAFVCKFTAAGSSIVYSTFLGGIGLDTATAIAIDAGGTAYVTGNTTSPDFPMVSPVQSAKSGSVDAFVAAVNSGGSALAFSTFFGGNSADGGTAVALNGSGTIWIAGQTTSTNFPVQTPIQATGYSEGNGFVASMSQPVAQRASMLTPAPSTTFASSTVTFTWTDAGAAMYWMDVGSIRGHGNIFGGNLGTVTTKTVAGIPVDGSIVYVRLWSNISAVWQYNDYTYTAVVADPKAAIISPVPSSTLTGSTVTFTWNNSGAAMYWLDVGNAAGSGDIFGANLGTATSKTVSGIPTTTGATIFVRLWSNVNGAWVCRDYTYTASGITKATIGSPTPGSTLAGTTVTFSWVRTGASMYWLDVGLNQGYGGIYGANVGTQNSIVVSGIPTGHVPIYVRLWTFIDSAWQLNDYAYTGP
ncbi:MAG TPA: SBBP repeat-containing protein, partial [Edaphobacter sp.]|nr:SBBP repeat-containing protein [Edaphobacter sp.]